MITDNNSVYGTHTYTFRNSKDCAMELICEKSTHSFHSVAAFLKQLLSTTDRIKRILAFADTGNWILITTP